MTRTIPPSMGGILEELELEQPTLVTSAHLARLVAQQGVQTPVKVVAARLRERGWLLPTGRRGVWEFAPAAVAGAYSRNDPVTPLRAFLAGRPDARCALTFQAAAWAHGLADRAPARLEVAAATSDLVRQLPAVLAGTVFDPRLDCQTLRAVPVLAVESVIVHMAARPSAVRSWASALEWFPEMTQLLALDPLERELARRPVSVRARTGYLLQGLRPDLADALLSAGPVGGKTWFGPRGKLRRHDAAWQIADTLLPFDPRTLTPAT
ncbi:type IV toxin-antitoxin system AbiEi family antitoxin [Microbacterium sp.]|uniref:type IV toxin-antitoxin system AbiEi family antitoxin n=1 Tax=Microbacterium sp. TaxID=51671 RepID=UPI003C7500D2